MSACRQRYRELVDPIQATFQSAVKAQGWPPEASRLQRFTFSARLAPELEARRRTAYFLVDAMRYEMGRDLTEALEDFGSTSVEAATNVLPTTTPCGVCDACLLRLKGFRESGTSDPIRYRTPAAVGA